jgi:hypothetical protein
MRKNKTYTYTIILIQAELDCFLARQVGAMGDGEQAVIRSRTRKREKLPMMPWEELHTHVRRWTSLGAVGAREGALVGRWITGEEAEGGGLS